MTKTTLTFVAILAGLGVPPARAQGDDFSKVEIEATKISGSVTMLTGAGGNIGVSAGPDGILIVDDQFAPLAPKIKAALASIAPGAKLAFVLNTHFHGDHTGGNATLGREATIVAQENVRARLAAKPSPKEALPVVTFRESVTLWWNGEEIEVVHVPHGHTDGDSVIFFKGSNVVHMGDQFFNGTFPFVDLASGGDLAGYVKNVGDVLARIPAGAKIIPGHGPLATIDDLKRFQRMLQTTVEHVRKEIAASVSLEDAKKAGLPEEWKSWATDFVPVERWVETVYTSLAKK